MEKIFWPPDLVICKACFFLWWWWLPHYWLCSDEMTLLQLPSHTVQYYLLEFWLCLNIITDMKLKLSVWICKSFTIYWKGRRFWTISCVCELLKLFALIHGHIISLNTVGSKNTFLCCIYRKEKKKELQAKETYYSGSAESWGWVVCL